MTALTAYQSAVQTLRILAPELILLTVATAMMTAGAFCSLPRRVWSIASAASLGLGLILLILVRNEHYDPYAGVVVNDSLAFYARLIFLLTGLIVLGMAHDQVDDTRAPEFFGALLVINAGAMLVCSANELVFLFVGLELVSIPTYLLLYLARRTGNTQEVATKYFFLSIFSSGLLLFGMAYLYGATGISNLKALAYLSKTAMNVPNLQLGLVALIFMMAGLGFRVAAVPFHFYAPDVYQGSPAIMAAVLAWVPKGLGFVAILRTLVAVLGAPGADHPLTQKAALLAAILAVVTMTLGNTVALVQTNLKRLLAYSSIAHAGYLLIGVAVAFRNGSGEGVTGGAESLLYYLVAYAVMTLGAFAVIIALNSGERPVETVDDMAGLAVTHRPLALEMAICLFSLAGIPPLAGFVGKFELFTSAWSASRGDDQTLFQGLALIGAINSAIGAYYYLRIVVVMFLRPATGKPFSVRVTWPTGAAITACTILTVALGIFAAPIMEASHDSAVANATSPDPNDSPAALTKLVTDAELKSNR